VLAALAGACAFDLVLLDLNLPDLDNLRAALEWANQSENEGDLLIAIAGASAWIWHPLGLRLEGIEPVAGEGKSLLASWKTMQGKQYNPKALKTWLASETADWPHEAAAQVRTEYIAGSTPDVAIDVLLHFQ